MSLVSTNVLIPSNIKSTGQMNLKTSQVETSFSTDGSIYK